MKRCLYCYQPLAEHEVDFHASCCKKLFKSSIPPELPYTNDDMERLAILVIKSKMAVTGVQPKLSLEISKGEKKNESKRFTIVGLWGDYILKPPTPNYEQTAEVEDLTMHLAHIAKINIVPHSLIRLKSGQLAYITKRIDRVNKHKVHMEDFCQLTEKQTEYKYNASYEQIAKAILKFSTNPGLDLVNFAEMVLFSFITGNADMHLKNFSLIYDSANNPVLAPAYDMLSTAIVNPNDKEDLALNLNGKKKKLNRKDFEIAFSTMGLDAKQQANIFSKMEKAKHAWIDFINISFLSDDFKSQYIQLINDRFKRLNPICP